ncbi:hypothetical protein Tco_0500241 [Tanacetum coccineum]
MTPTCMTLELADRSISYELLFRSVLLVVDFEPDPRVPLILGRCFLKTSRALIDMYEGELTLRVDNEAITYNLDQTSRYSVNYDDMTANRIDVVELACEEYSQEVLEEVDAFLALADDSTSPEVDESYYDLEGDILILEALLNSDPSPPPNQGNYLPEIRKELKMSDHRKLQLNELNELCDQAYEREFSLFIRERDKEASRQKGISLTFSEDILSVFRCLVRGPLEAS